ncbi:hypothetical protein, partial [Stutzerimonas stutzeri]|uniref:hypothetical protein n=1 Tax=Stutzerimonas stutzeri TaxID=316 RepID=UPI001BD3E859
VMANTEIPFNGILGRDFLSKHGNILCASGQLQLESSILAENILIPFCKGKFDEVTGDISQTQIGNKQVHSFRGNLAQEAITFHMEEACVRIPLDIGRNETVTLLVDTGAEVSIIKHSAIHPETYINPDLKITLLGIYSGMGISLGLCTGVFK